MNKHHLDQAPSGEHDVEKAEAHDEVDHTTSESDPPAEPEHHDHTEHGAKQNPLKRFWGWAKTHKKLSIPITVVVVVGLLAAVPFTRYAVAGLFWKQDFPVLVLDSETNKPVSRAQVTVHGKSAFTDSQGKAVLHVPVGSAQLSVEKRYYKTVSQSVTVPILKPKTTASVQLQATGRQVQITVTNKVTKQAVKGAIAKAEGAEAQTDEKGEAVLVLPVNKTDVTATLSATGYNQTDVKVKITIQVDPANAFAITPSGSIYFLSNKTGKIDVVKTDLDGGNRKVVLAGTGNEKAEDTSLVASQDWKYMALLSKRDGGDNAKLFLIDTTANDQVINMDEGNARFASLGWNGHRFIYKVYRNNVLNWQAKQVALKSFDAETKKITVLDETGGLGTGPNDYLNEQFGSVYILANGQIVYSKGWYAVGIAQLQLPTRQATLNTVNADGSNHKTVRGFNLAPGVNPNPYAYYGYSLSLYTRPYEANALYIQFYDGQSQGKAKYFQYEDNAVSESSLTDDTFYNRPYYTYLSSPSNNLTFWAEPRDGKNTLFVGNDKGEDGKSVMSGTTLNPYGWFGEDYLLTSKNASELYIMPASGVTNDDQALKITDYYKPDYSYSGYGRGYGGY